jgi:hypothetical protein
VRAAQTKTWIGQKSYDEFNQKAVFVATGMMAAETGRNKLRPYTEKNLRTEEDGFALEHFDGDEEGGGGVDAGGREDDGD